MNRQTRSYSIALDGNLFKVSGRDFGKGGPMSICISSSKEPSGGNLKESPSWRLSHHKGTQFSTSHLAIRPNLGDESRRGQACPSSHRQNFKRTV
ncbi:hypothetical protein CDAR_557921 [Caerostris darwini]|uniref:Uncharacterized protein n=1 Tax=Caerostris darwini TaxID=1538125 RepID=A0AAV4VWK4_9ARAC|nr:hypothetical protein CDAR_557921 [Caerostris darwini]